VADSKSLDAFHMKCQRRILGISWHQFARNEEIAARTGLPPLSTTICCRRSAIFGHLARLGDEVPAHKALYSCVRLSQKPLPDPTWKRRPGRPRGRWIDQLRRDNNRPPADQWKLAIKRGHGGRATLRSHDYATTWPDLSSIYAINGLVKTIRCKLANNGRRLPSCSFRLRRPIEL